MKERLDYEFVGGDGKVYGPFTAAELESLVAQGRALETSQARIVGSGQWQTMDVLLATFKGANQRSQTEYRRSC